MQAALSGDQSMNDEQLLRYSRHILLEGVDIAGQEAISAARVLVVGAGGLGCPVALYLAASGVGTLVIADDDVVDVSNLQRQIAHATADVGSNKAQSLADSACAINPLLNVVTLPVRLQGAALQQAVADVDLVLDCSDNFATRLAVNRACVKARKPLVSGAAIRMEGQVAVFDLRKTDSPCYACLYGEDNTEESLTCSQSGVLAPLVGVIGSMQAVEALKLLANCGESLNGRVLAFDARHAEWRTLRLKKDAGCPACGLH